MNILRVALAILLLAGMAGSAAPAAAQEKSPNQTRRILIPLVVPGLDHGGERHRTDPNAPAKICFWRDTSGGTAFGKSGFCAASSSSAVGSQCACSSNTTGRPNVKWVGQVMLAPQGDGSSQVVR